MQTARNNLSPSPSVCSTYCMPRRVVAPSAVSVFRSQRSCAQIVSAEHQEVKRQRRPARRLATVQSFKVGYTVSVDPDHFRIKNGRALNPRRVASDQRIALRPISAVHRIEPHPSIADVDLQPIAVVLQLMRPARPGRGLDGDYRLTGMNESSRRVYWSAAGTTQSRHIRRYMASDGGFQSAVWR